MFQKSGIRQPIQFIHYLVDVGMRAKLFMKAPRMFTVVGRNASTIKPANSRVFLVKEEGGPILVPEN